MSIKSRLAIAAFVGVFALYTIGAAFRPDGIDANGQRLSQFRRQPVVEGGRVKPIDTVAITYLRLVSSETDFVGLDADPKSIFPKKSPAIRWLLDVMTLDLEDPESPAWHYEVFKIDNDQVLRTLKLPDKSGFRYKLKDVFPKFKLIQSEAEKALAKPKDQKASLYESKMVELHRHLQEYVKLAQFAEPRVIPPNEGAPAWGILPFTEYLGQASTEALEQTRDELDRMPPERRRALIDQFDRRVAELARQGYERRLAAAPPPVKSWKELLDAHKDVQRAEREGRKAAKTNDGKAVAAADASMSAAVTRFNNALVEVQKTHPANLTPRERFNVRLEDFYNKFGPFLNCIVLYIVAFVLGCMSLMFWHEQLRWTSFSIISLALLVHSFGILARVIIQGRPPVTNLYSSAIFIGWGAVLLGQILEAWYGYSIANIVGSSIGMLTSIVAHVLGSGNDTMEMMQAVLDTNFWLATHVVCITLGYTATFVAGFIGVLFIGLGLATPRLDSDLFKRLNQMLYGVICFATLLSFTGTVLGGIWADQSWGRFWGWDPKENGAVLIVIWNAIVLHARWAGLVKQRGLAVMAVFGNIVTAWSWFGTNMLGIGLHAYGFMEAAVPAILTFDGIMIAIMCCAGIPPRHWRSFGGQFDLTPKDVLPVFASKGKKRRLRPPQP